MSTNMKKHIITVVMTIMASLLLFSVTSTNAQCIGVTGYTSADCPQGTLPNSTTIIGYFSGDAFYEAGTSTTTIPGASVSVGGKIGNYFHSQGALVLDFGPSFVDDDGINTISFFAKVGAAHDWTTNPTVSVATFKADAGTRSITVQLVSATPNINLVVSYISASNETTTFTTPYALSTDTVFHENWNNIVIVRASSPLVPVEGVSIFINGKPTTDGMLIVDGDALLRTFAIDATGHLFGGDFAFIDEVSVWSNSVLEVDVPTIAGVYADGYCPGWESKYGGSDPIFAATYANDVLTIDVTVPKNSYQTVLYRIDNTPNLRDVCLTNADSFTTSAGASWTADPEEKCSQTFSLNQTLTQIYTGAAPNQWVVSLTQGGRTIDQRLDIYVTYSVINPDACYTVSSKVTITLQTYLTAQASTNFTTLDDQASFAITNMFINTNDELEIDGALVRKLPGISFNNILLTRMANSISYTGSSTECTYPTGNSCALTFTKDWKLLNSGERGVGGDHSLTFNRVNGGPLEIDFTMSYTVPGQPAIISGDTLSSVITFSSPDSIFRTQDTMQVTNQLDGTPTLPTNYDFTFVEGYFCCVRSPNALPVYGVNGNGCQSAILGRNNIVEKTHLVLGSTGLTVTQKVMQRSYALDLVLNNMITVSRKPLQNPLTCGLLLFSNFTDTTLARSVKMVADIDLRTAKVTTTSVLRLHDDETTKYNNSSKDKFNALLIAVLSVVCSVASMWL